MADISELKQVREVLGNASADYRMIFNESHHIYKHCAGDYETTDAALALLDTLIAREEQPAESAGSVSLRTEILSKLETLLAAKNQSWKLAEELLNGIFSAPQNQASTVQPVAQPQERIQPETVRRLWQGLHTGKILPEHSNEPTTKG